MVLKLGHFGEWIRNTWKFFEMWCWRRLENISWTERVKDKKVLHRVKKRRQYHTYN